jgi:hypothetical protein
MKKSHIFYCLLVLVNLIYLSANAQNVFRTTTATVIGYLEALPQDYNSNSDKYPVVIFLHGLGERGANSTDPATLQTSISTVERNGPPKLVKYGEQFPFILISPQLKSNYGDWPSWYVNEVIDYCKTYLRIDERRIYLTGLSLGGGGTWWTAQDFPKEFAAIAPVCGSRNTLSKACLIAGENLPVWAFHGDSDTTVPYTRSVNMVNAINACTPAPNPLAKITIYPGINHNSWDKAYTNDHSVQNPNVYEWMLSYTNTINGTNKIPLANAGADVSKTLPANSVVLSGSGTDSDGTIASYTWSQLTGPSPATLTNAATASLTASNLVVGTYIFKLKVTDNSGDINADFVKVTVLGDIITVTAGADKTVVLPTSSVVLSGSGSTSDGTSLTYQWSEVSGTTATLSGLTSSTLTASSLVAGSYVFRLTAKDDLGTIKSDDVVVNVTTSTTNVAPVAGAGPDRLVTLPSDPITLFGTATDSDGTVVTFNWTKISGGACVFSSTTVLRPKVSDLASGNYVFRLTITDNNGATDTDDITVTADYPPVVNAGADRAISSPTTSITLTGGATDADGLVASYKWTQVSGNTATLTNTTSPTLSVSGLTSGIYIFRLTAKDNLGAVQTDDVTVTVDGSSQSNTSELVISAGPNRLVPLPTDPITLFGTATDSSATIVKYEWTKVSGGACSFSSTSVLRPKVSGLVSGTYVFRLTVTDDLGATASDDITITADYTPVVDAGIDYTITLPTNTITLKGSATDSDGTISSYLWAKSSGPVSATMTNKTTPTLIASGLVEGTYVFRLTVTDNAGGQTVDYATVVVAAATSSARSATLQEVALNDDQDSKFILFEKDNAKLVNASAAIYNESGVKVYEGKWNAEISSQVFDDRKGLYIYNLNNNGKRTAGKVFINE